MTPNLLCVFSTVLSHQVLASVQASTSTLLPSSTSLSYTTPSLFISTLLDTHNTYRQQHNASALTWNTSLATTSAQHASPCIFTHTHGSPGENLATGYANTTAAVHAWGHEGTEYDFSDPGFEDTTGHFTQVVWRSTRTLGCGATYCGAEEDTPGWFLVCQYWPAGNVEGAFEQNVQPSVEGAAAALRVGRRVWMAATVPMLAMGAISWW